MKTILFVISLFVLTLIVYAQQAVRVTNLTADVPEGTAAPTTPALIGCRADTTQNAAVDDGDAVRVHCDVYGNLSVLQKPTTPVTITDLDNMDQAVSASPAVLDNIYCTPVATSSEWIYVQLFNTATPTVGMTAPDAVVGFPPEGGSGPSNRNWDFSSAISAAATTTPTGSTAASVDVVCTFGIR